MKCLSCESTKVKTKRELLKTSHVNRDGNPIEVTCEVQICLNCGEDWISSKENERIQEKINFEKYEYLTVKQIKAIRESLPIKTKAGLAKFLCLNEKAFSKWENKISVPNRAYDLLLRLIAYSENNFLFVKHLHDNHFKFNPNEYYFLKKVKVKNEHTGFFYNDFVKQPNKKINKGFVAPSSRKTKSQKKNIQAADSYEPIDEAA